MNRHLDSRITDFEAMVDDLATDNPDVRRLIEDYRRKITEKPLPKKPRKKIVHKRPKRS